MIKRAECICLNTTQLWALITHLIGLFHQILINWSMGIPFSNSKPFTTHRLSSVRFGDGISITHVLCDSIECREKLNLLRSFSLLCTNSPLIYCYLSNGSPRMAYRVPITIVCKQHSAYVRQLDENVGWKFLGWNMLWPTNLRGKFVNVLHAPWYMEVCWT